MGLILLIFIKILHIYSYILYNLFEDILFVDILESRFEIRYTIYDIRYTRYNIQDGINVLINIVK